MSQAPSAAAGRSAFTEDFRQVRAAEIARVNLWRRKARGGDPLPDWPEQGPLPIAGNGLAISGGGIRSASFALGALQALDASLSEEDGKPRGIHRIDYLSTVSGGGYTGSSMIVAMNQNGGAFPFASDAADKADTPALGHLRNYSRYLIPGGFGDLIRDIWVVLRGLLVNLIFVFGLILTAAGLTGLCNPTKEALLLPDILGFEAAWLAIPFAMSGQMMLTRILLALTCLLLLLWAIAKSRGVGGAETRGRWPTALGRLFWVLVIVAIFEVQPMTILWLRQQSYVAGIEVEPNLIDKVADRLAPLVPILGSLGSVLAFFSRNIEQWVSGAGRKAGLRTLAGKIVGWVVLAVAALAVPLLIWWAYLHVAAWTDMALGNTPPPVRYLADGLYALGWDRVPRGVTIRLLAGVFLVVGLALLCLIWAMWFAAPNAHTLHRLYRDRLGKAFLFDPDPEKVKHRPGERGDLVARDRTRLADLRAENGPLHLINTAVNLQGSARLNRRGRNADLFFFSSAYSGSPATGYVSSDVGAKEFDLPDVGTAMAISGAAASSNMGGQSVRCLAPTLALLNIRLGYWQTNPRSLGADFATGLTRWERLRNALKLHFIVEMFSSPDERTGEVYLTDGGHIENLGLVELLRRRCRTIVVIDAENDPDMIFSSLARAERFARIDLGVRITLPWQAIAAGHRAASARLGGAAADAAAVPCPHVAVGRIEYAGGEGTIIYVKASLSGDENDYILDYKRRYPAFPQETTGDQFFSEEQFEAYRALGFHAMNGALTGKAHISGLRARASVVKGAELTAPEAGAAFRALID